jgi:hypothetical protein
MRKIETYPNGTLKYEVVDAENFEYFIENKINSLKTETTELIREKIEPHEEINALFGLLTPEETQSIVNHIKKCRKAYKEAKTTLLSINKIEDGADIKVADFLEK